MIDGKSDAAPLINPPVHVLYSTRNKYQIVVSLVGLDSRNIVHYLSVENADVILVEKIGYFVIYPIVWRGRA